MTTDLTIAKNESQLLTFLLTPKSIVNPIDHKVGMRPKDEKRTYLFHNSRLHGFKSKNTLFYMIVLKQKL